MAEVIQIAERRRRVAEIGLPIFPDRPTVHENIDKLLDIASLGDNWNGYGAVPFSRGLIVKACLIVRELCVQPEIFPTAANTLQLEYDKANGDYLEIQLGDNEESEVFELKHGEPGQYFRVRSEALSMNVVVNRFYER